MTAEVRTYITKFIALLLIISTIFSIAGLTAYAKETHLVTLILIPDDTITYSNFDSGYMTIVETSTGKSETHTLYPYNNFSKKIALEEGTYVVASAGINGRNDILIEADLQRVDVYGPASFVIYIRDSKKMESNTTTLEYSFKDPVLIEDVTDILPTQGTTSDSTEFSGTTNPSQSIIDPSNPSYQEPSTLFPIMPSDTSENESSTDLTITNPYYTNTETSTQDNTEQNHLSENSKIFIPILIILLILTIICITFFILLNKKNKEK